MLKLKTQRTDVVSQLELEAIKRKRKELDKQRAEVDALARDLRDREQNIIVRIEAGVPVDGQATVITRRRQNISWLTIVKKWLGPDAVVRAKNEWPLCRARYNGHNSEYGIMPSTALAPTGGTWRHAALSERLEEYQQAIVGPVAVSVKRVAG